MKSLRSLRAQVAAAMFLAASATVGIALSSTLGLMAYGEMRVDALLSPEGRAARAALASNRLPADRRALQEALDAQGLVYGERDLIDRSVLITIAVCALGMGGVFAVVFANRLSRPLEHVSRAAQAVAAGDFTVRAATSSTAAGEMADLIENFNRMAQTLEGQDRHATEFLAAIAHELRTPLAILRGRLQGVLDGVYQCEPAHIIGMIRHVDALTRIVSDLSVVSLASAGRLAIHPIDLDLAEELDVLLVEMGPELQRQGLTLEADLRPAPARVDPNRLRQAALALIDNVVAHARTGGVVRVETRSDGAHVSLAVLDRGGDLPAEGPGRVFEPFWRNATASTDHGGHGLGLSVVAAIARAHAGDVTVHARRGGGAVFTLTLNRR